MEVRHYTVGIYRQVSGTIIIIENAMTAMEDLRSQGKINYYGIATYAGLRVDHRHMSYIALDDIVKAAEKAIAKAASKGRFHKKNAARQISRLASKLSSKKK